MIPRKAIVVGIIVFILLSVGLIVYAFISNAAPRATLSITISPEEATATINGASQSVKNGQKITVTPGSLTVDIKRDEFETYHTTFQIKNGENKEVIASLAPLTDAAKKIIDTPASQRVIEKVGGIKVAEGAKNLQNEYPILKSLPINDKFYRIVTCSSQKYPDDNTKIAVCINLYNTDAKQSATNEIVSRGYKLSDYEIIYVDASFETIEAQEYGAD